MRRFVFLALGLMLGALSPALAQAPRFTEGTPVVVVGRVSSPPKGEINEQKMQVAVGPRKTDYTLHFRDAQMIGLQGQKIDEDGLNSGQWVRAEGMVMDDPRRIRVSRVQVIAPDEPGYRVGAFNRPGYDMGYVMSTAGSRETFPVIRTVQPYGERAVTLIGRVSNDTGEFNATRRIQVETAGNEWTLNVPDEAMVMDAKGEKISVHEIAQGQWVRVHGWQTDDLRMRVSRIENIGAQEAFRTSTFYRTDWPMGYVTYTVNGAAPAAAIGTMTYSGTITAIDRSAGFLTLRDEGGKEHRIDIGRDASVNQVAVGDRVNIRVTEERR